MRGQDKKRFLAAGILSVLFVLFTILVKTVDVRPIGPENSAVGFAAINQLVHETLGVHMFWYKVTEVLGVLAILVAACFALLGVFQLVTRKKIAKVDRNLLLLAVHYIVTIGFYVLFEVLVINYRPVVLEEGLEASYPSSHTVLTLCVLVTAMTQLRIYLAKKPQLRRVLNVLCVAVIVVTVLGRLASGVHWFTDILGGVLLASALNMCYDGLVSSDVGAAEKRI